MKLRVKLIKSHSGDVPRNRRTALALGLRKVNQEVVHEDSPSIRGMLQNVRHLIEVRIDDNASA